eukprot:CAMPEP_0118938856 /NCGR_PEP_ID=MMETSP1169-20130426/27267_1 /TAXON_ID=36882 /ORGANISM="Pyramimonas obovata, Strain CCMP722" /LENGTH=325 /DNA_ID=CAMNT_0006882951 /DNA_START=123 /DNA_END=1100 /DNA_ORIENTATION=+
MLTKSARVRRGGSRFAIFISTLLALYAWTHTRLVVKKTPEGEPSSDEESARSLLITVKSTHAGKIVSPPKGPFCQPRSLRSGDHTGLDSEFYTKYQSSVLHSRKPFAIDKGFFMTVEKYYSDKNLWLDAGAGTCGTMKAISDAGHSVFGVELSDVCRTECSSLARQGKVFSTGLNEIPFPDRYFDLVWSSEVFEHIPIELINQSVAEVVRVAKRDLFLSIAMKRSGFDPDPPAKPRIHLSVLPQSWWDATFALYGCRVNTELRGVLLQARYSKATFFPYICHEAPVVKAECNPAVARYADCYASNSGDNSKCLHEKQTYLELCTP